MTCKKMEFSKIGVPVCNSIFNEKLSENEYSWDKVMQIENEIAIC